MKRTFLFALCVLIAACGTNSAESLSQNESELAADAWQYIYAVRRIDSTHFEVNPVGNYNVTCPDQVVRTSCSVNRVTLNQTGLSSAKQTEIFNRIASESVSETRISLLLKGILVKVVDHTTSPTTISYDFRATAAYESNSVRDHAGIFGYVKAGIQSNGYQPVVGVNGDLGSRTISITYQVDFDWSGPGGGPSSYSADSFVTITSWQPVPGGGTFGPFIYNVDQIFRRVVN